MAWQNAFDLGPCTLTLHQPNGNFDSNLGVVAKGQTVTVLDGASQPAYQLSVSTLGEISVIGLGANVNLAAGTTCYVRVQPAISLSGHGLRVRGFSLPTSADITHTYGATTPSNFLLLSSLTPPTPDPLDITALAGPPQFLQFRTDSLPASSSPLVFKFTAEVNTPVIAAGAVSGTLYQADPQPTGTLTPVVTSDGTPVTPSSLAIITPPANGSATVVGATLQYTPATGFSGVDTFTYQATVSGTLSNVAQATVSVVGTFKELGNATTILVSAWDRVRMFQGRLTRGEKRAMIVDFNGAFPSPRTIVSAKWQCALPYIAFMANARISPDRRTTAVDVTANYPNVTDFKCTATLDNGEQYVQLIRMEVDDTYWFSADTLATVGPTVLVAT